MQCVTVLLILASFSIGETLATTCPENEMIRCRVNDRCTRIRYICDGDNDCGDMSDEQSDLCDIWRQETCERGYARCYRFGAADCVTLSRYCELTDPPCEGDVDPRICQMLNDEQLEDINTIVVRNAATATGALGESEYEKATHLAEEFEAQLPGTLKHEDCPELFTSIGGKCVSIFHPGNVTWGAARSFCKSIGGDILALDDDYNFFATLVKQLHQYSVTTDFWVGGYKQNETESAHWEWVNGHEIELGAPYWAIRSEEACQPRVVNSLTNENVTHIANHGRCYHYSKAPSSTPHGYCTALTFELLHHMSDEDCLSNRAPLCIHKKNL